MDVCFLILQRWKVAKCQNVPKRGWLVVGQMKQSNKRKQLLGFTCRRDLVRGGFVASAGLAMCEVCHSCKSAEAPWRGLWVRNTHAALGNYSRSLKEDERTLSSGINNLPSCRKTIILLALSKYRCWRELLIYLFPFKCPILLRMQPLNTWCYFLSFNQNKIIWFDLGLFYSF